MNYRHAFHAGNFADVLKHAVLCRILWHLRGKPTAFRVIDTHGGAGLYDLAGEEASRGGEWRGGIERLRLAVLAPHERELFAPYLETVAAFNAGEGLSTYPGSPMIARAWLRGHDRLIACEIEPGAAAALAESLRGERRAKAVCLDGWTALAAYVPPKERRGVVLIDPPFEEAEDFARLAEGLATAHRKWPTGIYGLWYPIKNGPEPERLARQLRRLHGAKILRAELSLVPRAGASLAATGLIVVNPPWTLADELATMLSALGRVLADNNRGSFRLDWLSNENQSLQ
jgi:23S rRNA (adenine2030-N6)-methyltransferase